jgi:NAD(P)-dependent dehydrogenase (short-subunit alcohol dehydrogenase family)
MEKLAGKVAVITGAASGIGRSLARCLGGEGMKLVLADVEAEPLAGVVTELEREGREVLGVPTNVADAREMDALGERALGRFGAVHVVCNNAGVGAGGLMWELSTQDWEFVLGPNLWGVIHGVRVFARHLVAQNEGHIVNTASVAGLISVPGLGAYNVSKHGVVALSETLQAELRVLGSAVGVSVLCPGFVNTKIFEPDRHRVRQGQERASAASLTAEQRLARARELGGTFLEPDDVALQVLEAIRARRFYVLTHPGTELAVQARLEAITKGQAPVQFDSSAFANQAFANHSQ